MKNKINTILYTFFLICLLTVCSFATTITASNASITFLGNDKAGEVGVITNSFWNSTDLLCTVTFTTAKSNSYIVVVVDKQNLNLYAANKTANGFKIYSPDSELSLNSYYVFQYIVEEIP